VGTQDIVLLLAYQSSMWVLCYLVLEQGRPQKWTKEQNLNPLSQHRLALKSSFLTFHFSFSRDLYLTHLPSTPQLQFGIGSFHSVETEYQKINHTLIVYPNPPKSPCYARSVPKPISRINIGSLRPSPTASRCTHLAAAGPTSRAREEREERRDWGGARTARVSSM